MKGRGVHSRLGQRHSPAVSCSVLAAVVLRAAALQVAVALLAVGLLAGVAAAAEPAVPPRPAGPQARPIVDLADVLTPEQEARLDTRLRQLYETTGITAGVLTVRRIAPETIEGYAQRVFDAWQLGRPGKDDGLLLVVAVEDRRVRLQVGYGLEPLLPDGRIGELLDRYALPAFRAGNYGEGIVAVVEAAAAILTREIPAGARPTGESAPRVPAAGRSRGFNPAWLILLFVVAIVLARWLGSRGGRGGPRRGLYYGPRRRRYGGPVIVPGGFGGFGGSASGGGWGGFGGRSGGGGASRGW